MDGLIIYNLFFLSPVVNFVGAILKYAFPKFKNSAISNTLMIIAWIVCGTIGWWQGENLITVIGQYALFNGTLVSSVAVHGWDSAYGVKTIISDLIAREKKIFF